MCKFTAFVFTEDGDIDYVGRGKMETVYHTNNQYLRFLNQQVNMVTHRKKS